MGIRALVLRLAAALAVHGAAAVAVLGACAGLAVHAHCLAGLALPDMVQATQCMLSVVRGLRTASLGVVCWLHHRA